jgi:outer membrane protein assembly factor BamE (lipoprotein component of BamABCDE complex)
MKYIILIIFFFTLSCTLNKVKNNHGASGLEKKYTQIYINKSNTNDIVNVFGPPSTKSAFDNKVWIYIERKKTNNSVFKLGTQKFEKNNVVVLEINEKGLLKKKDIYDLKNMNKYKFTENTTSAKYSKNSYIAGVLSSLKEKMNAPTKRNKKNK